MLFKKEKKKERENITEQFLTREKERERDNRGGFRRTFRAQR